MKTRIFIILLSLAAFFSCNKRPQFVAEGTVENPVFEGSTIFLVALDAPVTRKVDSTIIRNQRFRFQIPADSLGVKILRVPARFPDVIEDFIVVTEPGTVHVQMSASSKGSGTRLNNMLMDWKQQKRVYDSVQFDNYMRQGSPGTDPALTDSLLKQSGEMAGKHLSYVMNTINQNLHNGIGLLFFKIYYNDLPKETKDKVLELTGDLYLKKDLQIWSTVTMDQKLAE